MIPGQLRFHHETEHLSKNLGRIQSGIEIVISAKLHGSSCILSKVKTLRKLNWREKLAKMLGVKVVETEYSGIYSSGKPKSSLVKGIDNKWINEGQSFYSQDIWKTAYEDYKRRKVFLYGRIFLPPKHR